VIICPGGGYNILAYDWEGTDIARWLNSRGIAAFVLKYRLPGSKSNIEPYKSPLLDAQRAMRLVRSNAEQWNVDPGKIGIMGFSAGGHLASTLSTHFDEGNPSDPDPVERVSCRPDFSILIYPVISFTGDFTHAGSRRALLGEEPGQELVNNFSNELQVTKETPPAILIHAGDDTGVPVENSMVYYQALRAHQVSSELHIYPYGGHGFSLAIGKGHLSTWTDRVIDWIRSLHP
jgi:acetyl esterase/lipase